MVKNRKPISKKYVNDSFLKFVASVSTFMQNCNNVLLSKNLSMYIAYYMWHYVHRGVNGQCGISLEMYNDFVNDVSIVYQKFGVTDEYNMCKLVWKIKCMKGT